MALATGDWRWTSDWIDGAGSAPRRRAGIAASDLGLAALAQHFLNIKFDIMELLAQSTELLAGAHANLSQRLKN